MADLTGHTLGKYQILERLGRGGMADVYKGYQPGLDRYVAIKVLHSHLSEDPDFITRFRREAKSVAELRHPNIVQVFDFDVQGDVYYMVMEYIEGGETLKQRLQKLAEQGQRLPIEQTLDIMIKLADALAYAHDKGMIHRDIKPANVLLPGLDRPVLSDFGIARLLGETGLTASGAMIGTPAYMSPEQGRGEHGDARSDVYALGIVFYEMLTGRPPYDADTPYAIILKHINDPLTPPHQITSPMPEVVERIVLKCLAKDANERYASMAELRDALRGAQAAIDVQKTMSTLVSPAPVPAPIGSQLETLQPAAPAASITGRAGRLKPAWLIGVGILVIALGVLVVFASRGNPPPASPVTPSSGVKLSATTPAGTSDAARLIDDGYQRLISDDTTAARDLFQQALAVEPHNPRALIGRAIVELASYGDMNAAADDLDRAAQITPDDPFLHFGRGLLYRRSDQHRDDTAAEQEFTQAIQSCHSNAALCSEAYYERSQLRAWALNNIQGALDDAGQAIEAYPDSQSIDTLYASRADIRFQADDEPGAIEDLQRAYATSKSPDYLEKAAAFAVQTDDYDRALSLYTQLIDDQAGDPHYVAGRGYVEWQAGQVDQAMQSADRALQLNSRLLEAHYLKGLLLLDADQPEEALAELQPITAETNQDALDQMSRPFLNPDFGHEIFYDTARAAEATSDHEAALKALDQSLQRKADWSQPYILRAQILKEQGDLAGVRENYVKALDYADDPDLKATIEKALADLAK
jgi:serine/threonine protein kinase